MRLLAVTYYNAVTVTENQLLFVIGRHIRVSFSKRLQISCTRLQNYTIGACLLEMMLLDHIPALFYAIVLYTSNVIACSSTRLTTNPYLCGRVPWPLLSHHLFHEIPFL